MSRRIRTFLFGLDLTLLGLVSAACVASQFVGYSARVLIGDRGFVFDTVRGEASLWTASVARVEQPAWGSLWYDSVQSQTVEEMFAAARNRIDRAWMLFGFAYARGTELYFGPPVKSGKFVHTIAVPYWFMILALSVWPVKVIVRRLDADRTRRRLEAGECPVCGYDLRSAGERCPECGARSPYLVTRPEAGNSSAQVHLTAHAPDGSSHARATVAVTDNRRLP